MSDYMLGYYTNEELTKLGLNGFGANVMIARSTQLINPERIKIGNNVRIDNFCTIVPSGNAIFSLGNYIHICAYVFMNGLEDIIIEDYCTIGNFNQFFTSMDDFSGNHLTGAVVPRFLIGTLSGKIILQKHTLIAPSCIILPGVTLAIGTAVGAHSLVKNSTNEFSIYGGIPAKYIKPRSQHLLELEKSIRDPLK